MSEKRPFAEDQAEGLRRLFAGSAKKAFVVGFIASSRNARAGTAMELLALRLRAAGSSVLLVDEQARPQLHGASVLHRPAGVGDSIERHRHQHDLIFVDAYPSRESFIHSADMLVVTAQAPQFDSENVRLLLKAISRSPQELALMLTCDEDGLSVIAARQAVEDIASMQFKRKLQWLGSIPTGRPGAAIAGSLDGCIERLERIRQNKETADV